MLGGSDQSDWDSFGFVEGDCAEARKAVDMLELIQRGGSESPSLALRYKATDSYMSSKKGPDRKHSQYPNRSWEENFRVLCSPKDLERDKRHSFS